MIVATLGAVRYAEHDLRLVPPNLLAVSAGKHLLAKKGTDVGPYRGER